MTKRLRHVLWRINGGKIAPTGARSWMGSRTLRGWTFRWFAMRLHKPHEHVTRKPMYDYGRTGGYVGWIGPRWTSTIGTGKEKP